MSHTPAQALDALRSHAEVTSRAVLAVVSVAPGADAAATEALLGETADGVRATWPDAAVVRVRRGEDADAISAWNGGRDVVLHAHPVILFLCGSGGDVRWLRARAPDLTAAVDLFVALAFAPVDLDEATLFEGMRARARDVHRAIDVGGMAPPEAGPQELDLEAVYAPEAGVRADRPLSLSHPNLLRAPSGAGKTTTLRWLTLQSAKGRAVGGLPADRLVLCVPLAVYGAILAGETLDLPSFLDRWVGQQLGHPGVVPLARHLPRLVLLFDGLDEVGSDAARRMVLREAAELWLAGAVVVVSARDEVTDAVEDALKGWMWHTLRPLSRAAALALMERVVGLRWQGKLAELFLGEVRGIVGRGELVGPLRRPLFAVMKALHVRVMYLEGDTEGSLYEVAFLMLLSPDRRRGEPMALPYSMLAAELLAGAVARRWLQAERCAVPAGEWGRPEVVAHLPTESTFSAEEIARAVAAMLPGGALVREERWTGMLGFAHTRLAAWLASVRLRYSGGLASHPVGDPLETPPDVVAYVLAASPAGGERFVHGAAWLDALGGEPVNDPQVPRLLAAVLAERPHADTRTREGLALRVLECALPWAPIRRWHVRDGVPAVAAMLRVPDAVIRLCARDWLAFVGPRRHWESYVLASWDVLDDPLAVEPPSLLDALSEGDIDPRPLAEVWLRDTDPLVRAHVGLQWLSSSGSAEQREARAWALLQVDPEAHLEIAAVGARALGVDWQWDPSVAILTRYPGLRMLKGS